MPRGDREQERENQKAEERMKENIEKGENFVNEKTETESKFQDEAVDQSRGSDRK